MKGWACRWMGVVCVLGFTGCAAPAVFGNQVRVDGNYPGANSVQALIQGTLRVNDGIAVSVDEGGYSPSLTPHVLDIEAANSRITVIAGDGWMDQKTADQMAHTLNPNDNEVDRVVALIDEIHDWQDAHPRPAPPPPPTPAVEPAAKPNGWVLLGLAGTALAVSVWAGIVLLRRRWMRYREHRHQLSVRADQQAARYASGDLTAMYGDFPPAKIGD